ncbi:MAG: outer membrane beta-barrel protein [Thermoanaerobaculia bacterium]|jgi:hypothetical protein
MRRSVILALLTVVAMLATFSLAAADNGFYLGAAAGQSTFSVGDFNSDDFDGDATGYKVFAGGRFLTLLGVEGSYVDFGEIEGDSSIENAAYKTDVNGVTLEGVAYLPLGIADIFVKGGIFKWESDLTSTISGDTATISSDGNDLVYGAGVQFRIQSFALRAEVEYYDVENADELYMISVGGSYTF